MAQKVPTSETVFASVYHCAIPELCKGMCHRYGVSITEGIQTDITEADLTAGLVCVTKYNEAYSHATLDVNVKLPVGASDAPAYAVLGARYSSGVNSGKFKMAAIGDYDYVFAERTKSTAYENRGTWWYYLPAYSMGFAPSATVSLNSADTTSGSDRMSWHINSGGYRAGHAYTSTADLNKVVLYCN
jgi:hypothetical protein